MNGSFCLRSQCIIESRKDKKSRQEARGRMTVFLFHPETCAQEWHCAQRVGTLIFDQENVLYTYHETYLTDPFPKLIFPLPRSP